jgi:hypothetical protein
MGRLGTAVYDLGGAGELVFLGLYCFELLVKRTKAGFDEGNIEPE